MTPNVRRLNTRLPLAVVALALLAATIGCGASAPRGSVESGPLHAQWVDLPDGRAITCVYLDGSSGEGGLDCDWATAAREGEQP